MKKKLLISFSGGQTSAYMTQLLLSLSSFQNMYEMKIVFANTGKENERTLEFVKECSDYFGFECIWVEALVNPIFGKGTRHKIVTFESASREGEPFDAVNAKYGIPSHSSPHCTRELKRVTIESYLRSIGWKGYYKALGIRSDEIDRVNPNHNKLRIIYPLITYQYGMTKKTIQEYWDKMPFKLGLKDYEGNCDCCWKKSLKKLIRIAEETPEKFNWWESQEKKYENYVPSTHAHNEKIKLPFRMYYKNTSVADIRKLALIPKLELNDTPNSCEESCEAF